MSGLISGPMSAVAASASPASQTADPPVSENASSIVPQPDGAPSIFESAPDGSLWNYWYVNGTWDEAEVVGAGVVSSPVAVLQSDGAPSVFFDGTGGSLWNYWYAGGTWDGAEIVASGVSSAPTAMLQTDGSPSVFVQGAGKALLNYWYIASQGIWGSATVAGQGTTYSAPAVISQPTDGAPSVFVQGPAAVWNYWYVDGTWNTGFVAWDQQLSLGDSGPAVAALQARLFSLGYWVDTSGVFDDSTQQALWALQKAAGIPRTGVADSATFAALSEAVVPQPRSTSGYVIEVDLEDDLLMFVNNGQLEYTFNTSTGGGYIYDGDEVADTPVGHFEIYRAVDGLVVDSLGALWRPRFFTGGYAIHGDSNVPPEPVSHGCVRVSNEAIDFIWSAALAPIGTQVWVY